MPKLQVLLAEDEELVRKDLAAMLESIGCEVVAEASNGAEVIEKFIEYVPELVVTDVSMPMMSALDAIEQIYKKGSARVLFITGTPCPPVLEKYPRSLCISKPVSKAALENAVAPFLARKFGKRR